MNSAVFQALGALTSQAIKLQNVQPCELVSVYGALPIRPPSRVAL
jgi:hypothetical protein